MARTVEEAIAEYMLASENELPDFSIQKWLESNSHIESELREFLEIQSEIVGVQRSSKTVGAIEAIDQSHCSGNDSQTTPSVESLVGQDFGDYEIVSEIDRGGMGVVFKAKQKSIDRLVALKIIRAGELATLEEVQRFKVEATAAATLSHPGIVPIYDVGQIGSLLYYTMAFIDGRNLSEWNRYRQQPENAELLGATTPKEIAQIVVRLSGAIAHAHSRGVFHRDLKPANVLLQDDQPIVIDFGLAKLTFGERSPTLTGQILGTPAYIAPEIVSGTPAGQNFSASVAAEAYSIGAILYFLCARQAPFSGETPFDVMLQVLDRYPPPPSTFNPAIPRELDWIVAKSLHKKPDLRYQTVTELANDLQRWLHGESTVANRGSWSDKISALFRRSPNLIAHLLGIGCASVVVAMSHVLSNSFGWDFVARIFLMVLWMALSCGFQWWYWRSERRDAVATLWGVADVTLFTLLISFASEPRSLLLIGYPMMIAASGLFYRVRFVVTSTILCLVGFIFLKIFESSVNTQKDAPFELGSTAPSLIFIAGLIVVGLTQAAMIQRIRRANRILGS